MPSEPHCASQPKGTESASKFPEAPPERRLARSEVPSGVVARDMAGKDKLAVSISSKGSPMEGGRKKNPENQKKKNPPNPTFPVVALPPAHSEPRGGLRGGEAGPRAKLDDPALTSVSSRGAAHSASSELRSAVPGPGRSRTGCIAAAALGQHPGALHAKGRISSDHQ